ncbi:MAG: hypothetical protein DHS20C03_33130 [Minwuia thermotolerans]|nr:MAG: hypothetical protein DHS20C03_33130 [Minwuia thermotolerans]
MTPKQNDFLRRALQIDFGISLVCTFALIAASVPLAELSGLPHMLVLGTGLVFVPFLILLGWVLHRPTLPRQGVRMVIGLNVAWAVGTIIFLASGIVSPTVYGYVLIAGIGVAVAVFAEMEIVGLRRVVVSG